MRLFSYQNRTLFIDEGKKGKKRKILEKKRRKKGRKRVKVILGKKEGIYSYLWLWLYILFPLYALVTAKEIFKKKTGKNFIYIDYILKGFAIL